MHLSRCLGLVWLTTIAVAKGDGQMVNYGVGSWKAEGLGNHRAVVEVSAAADAVRVHLPWRRRDADPEKKAVLVRDAAGAAVTNVAIVAANRESGDVVFQPTAGPGRYYLYYLPFTTSGISYSPTITYTPPTPADEAWLQRCGLAPAEGGNDAWRSLPEAVLLGFEAVSEFHRFDPMELIATAAEMKALLEAHPGEPCLLFPEDRAHPIRMTTDLPYRWIERGPGGTLLGEPDRNEFYVFQVGVYAVRELAGLSVAFSDLRAGERIVAPADAFTCFNTSGTDWLGRAMRPRVNVPAGHVQALWCGVQIPAEAPPGTARATVTVAADGVPGRSVDVELTIGETVLADGGVSDLGRLARLKWLNSTIGLDDEVTAPFTPLTVDGRTIGCLGRAVTFDASGFLESIRCGERELLAAPLGVRVETADGLAAWTGEPAQVTSVAPGKVTWAASRSAGPLRLHLLCAMECDGYLNVTVEIEATETVELRDVRLDIPLRREVAKYLMGLGRRGGLRPAEWRWKWEPNRATNLVWLGDVHGGIQCKLKGPRDDWNLWGVEPGALASWGNGGRGGCDVLEEGGDRVVARAYTGPRTLTAGEPLALHYGLLITPTKPLDRRHFAQRYLHEYSTVPDPDAVVANGANIVNIHQGNAHNPYINYPFRTADKLAEYVREAHARGLKVKIYYTCRELSNFTAELFCLRSLGHEVFHGGGGGGDSWLQEHLVSDYGAAWHQPYDNGEVDAAIGTVGLSRWHNYYLEGLGWLVREVGIDGLYLDGIGYNREIMKRVRKVLDRGRPGCLIDFHSGDSYGWGDARCSPASIYMEHFPYIDSLWFGEMYDYDLPPDYWLIEISGIPFGLYGEMLQGGGNPWRGMLYGMTNRLHWQGDPREIWKQWDAFGIDQAEMIGYWEPHCPVTTGRDDVLATVYRRPGRALVAIASWAPERADCRLRIDWPALGLDPDKAHLYAPEIPGFQPCRLFQPSDPLPAPVRRGWLLWLDEQPHEAPPVIDAYAGRRLILADDFDRAELGDPWITRLSERGGAKLALQDGALAISGLDNCYAYAERPLPAGATLVQCLVDTGTDAGATWGPGLAVLWPDGRVVRVNVRSMGTFGVDDGADFVFPGHTAQHRTYRLRIRIETDRVYVETSEDGEWWEHAHAYPRERYPGDPVAIRLGKSGPGGRPEDYERMARPGECAIRELRVYGPNP